MHVGEVLGGLADATRRQLELRLQEQCFLRYPVLNLLKRHNLHTGGPAELWSATELLSWTAEGMQLLDQGVTDPEYCIAYLTADERGDGLFEYLALWAKALLKRSVVKELRRLHELDRLRPVAEEARGLVRALMEHSDPDELSLHQKLALLQVDQYNVYIQELQASEFLNVRDLMLWNFIAAVRELGQAARSGKTMRWNLQGIAQRMNEDPSLQLGEQEWTVDDVKKIAAQFDYHFQKFGRIKRKYQQ